MAPTVFYESRKASYPISVRLLSYWFESLLGKLNKEKSDIILFTYSFVLSSFLSFRKRPGNYVRKIASFSSCITLYLLSLLKLSNLNGNFPYFQSSYSLVWFSMSIFATKLPFC